MNLLKDLGDSQAFGQDGIDAAALKPVAKEISVPLCHLINLSLVSERFAKKWKISKVTPRLKSRDLNKFEPASYRPVAILSTLSKLVERTAQTQLLEYVEKTKQLNDSNHAYRKEMSTTTTLMEILDEIYQGVEARSKSVVMAIDQSAAFECVDRKILIEKLKLYKIGRGAINWIDDYLSYRTHFVAIGGGVSKMTAINSGVPQGSVIGPLLYALYTNEITELAKDKNCKENVHKETSKLFSSQCNNCGKISNYADDTTYVVTNKDRQRNQENIVRTLDNLKVFLNDSKLAINMDKTSINECMLKQMKGRAPGNPPTLTVEKTPGIFKTLQNSKYSRILGANIEGNIQWSSHLETGGKALFPLLRKHLGLLKHKGKSIPNKSRNNLAKGLIGSRLNYLLPLWGGATTKYIKKAQVIWNTAARWATGLSRRTRTSELMKAAGWMSIEELVKVSTAILTWKLVHSRKPARLLDRMVVTEDYRIETQQPRLQFSKKCYRWRACEQWNKYPA